MNVAVDENLECPACAPVAPFWMTTFADMALLLMAFFALLYSFINIDASEQSKFAAAIRSSFGVMTLDVVESDNSSNMFSGKTYTDKEVKGKPGIVAPQTQKMSGSEQQSFPGGKKQKPDFSAEGVVKELENVLSEEMEAGVVKVKVDEDQVVVELQSFVTSGAEAQLQESSSDGLVVSQRTLDIAAHIVRAQATTKVKIALVQQELNAVDSAFDLRQKDATQTYQTLLQVFRDEIKSKSALVELKEDQLLVRLSNAEAFMSGRATLNQETQKALAKLSKVISDSTGKVRVEGHSDSVPIIFSERFISNWDLSAARAASVAAALIQNSGLEVSRFKIVGFADSRPIASNANEQGRRSNRRTDIFIKGSAEIKGSL